MDVVRRSRVGSRYAEAPVVPAKAGTSQPCSPSSFPRRREPRSPVAPSSGARYGASYKGTGNLQTFGCEVPAQAEALRRSREGGNLVALQLPFVRGALRRFTRGNGGLPHMDARFPRSAGTTEPIARSSGARYALHEGTGNPPHMDARFPPRRSPFVGRYRREPRSLHTASFPRGNGSPYAASCTTRGNREPSTHGCEVPAYAGTTEPIRRCCATRGNGGLHTWMRGSRLRGNDGAPSPLRLAPCR